MPCRISYWEALFAHTRAGDMALLQQPVGHTQCAFSVAFLKSLSTGRLLLLPCHGLRCNRLRQREYARVAVRAAADSFTGPESTTAASGRKRQYSLPATMEESVDQARIAFRQAIRDGQKRLQLELLLPLIGATDLDDWPGGIQQQFKAAAPMVSSLLAGLLDDNKTVGKDGDCRRYILADEDAVGVWESDHIALVLFPTAETLSEVQALASVEDRPLLLVNAQWRSGQVISDFGFGALRKAREAFVSSFVPVYSLQQLRILGEDVRVFRQYPGDWQVFVVDGAGGSQCVAVERERPSYSKLQEVLKSRKGSNAGKGWMDRLLGELTFNQNSLKRD